MIPTLEPMVLSNKHETIKKICALVAVSAIALFVIHLQLSSFAKSQSDALQSFASSMVDSNKETNKALNNLGTSLSKMLSEKEASQIVSDPLPDTGEMKETSSPDSDHFGTVCSERGCSSVVKDSGRFYKTSSSTPKVDQVEKEVSGIFNYNPAPISSTTCCNAVCTTTVEKEIKRHCKNDPEVRKLQILLREEGLYHGRIDGCWGQLTAQAEKGWKILKNRENIKPIPKNEQVTIYLPSAEKPEAKAKASRKSSTKSSYYGCNRDHYYENGNCLPKTT